MPSIWTGAVIGVVVWIGCCCYDRELTGDRTDAWKAFWAGLPLAAAGGAGAAAWLLNFVSFGS